MPISEEMRKLVGDFELHSYACESPELHARKVETRNALLGAIEKLEAERDALAYWKESAMQLQSTWDVQAIGKALDLKLGTDILPEILPGIERLNKERDGLKVDLEEANALLDSTASFDQLLEDALGNAFDEGKMAARGQADYGHVNGANQTCALRGAINRIEAERDELKAGEWRPAELACIENASRQKLEELVAGIDRQRNMWAERAMQAEEKARNWDMLERLPELLDSTDDAVAITIAVTVSNNPLGTRWHLGAYDISGDDLPYIAQNCPSAATALSAALEGK
jgi:hypothetical protein